MRGAEGAFFLNPHVKDDRRYGMNVIEAAEQVGLSRLVYVSAYQPYANTPVLGAVLRTLLTWMAPRYAGKLDVSRRLMRSTVPHVELMPTNFFQNDETVREEIRSGTLLWPVGRKPVNRVDVRDIAAAAANALTDTTIPSGRYPLVGAEDLTGDDCARIWSAALGREVRHEAEDVAAWCAAAERAGEPRFTIDDYQISFGLMRRFGTPSTKDDVARTRRILGRAPRLYVEYVAYLSQRRPGGLGIAA
ncbi:MAG: NmrA family NAD(P)-binding protein [Myxococcaceae bacterium]|nr:NmrA family NAD(P)-binding protein [Myxococcaceae bacterium]